MARQDTEAGNLRRVSRISDALEDELGRQRPPRKKSRPLDSLIATLLSQNTNDRNSYRAWLSLRRQFPSWSRVHEAPWQAIAKAIEVGGLKNQKAQKRVAKANAKRAARMARKAEKAESLAAEPADGILDTPEGVEEGATAESEAEGEQESGRV